MADRLESNALIAICRYRHTSDKVIKTFLSTLLVVKDGCLEMYRDIQYLRRDEAHVSMQGVCTDSFFKNIIFLLNFKCKSA